MAVQDYIDHALASLPIWFSNTDRPLEFIKAAAVLFDTVEQQTQFWHDMTFILNSTGAWTNSHGKDRNLRRQEGETDEAFRSRIRGFSESLTFGPVLGLIQDMVDEAGIVGTVAMFELKPNQAYFGSYTSDTGTGAVFADGPGVDQVLVTLTGPPSTPPEINQDKLVISGAASSGNNGTFLIEGFQGDQLIITNASAVFETDATATWSWQKYDITDNVIDGFGRAYFNRGYRMADLGGAIVVILPFGCTEALRLSVEQALSENTAAGIQAIVECRVNP